MVNQTNFQIHGDNVVECVRVFDYIVAGLGNLVTDVIGPKISITCPVFTVKTTQRDLVFQFLPGYGEGRWNQDILSFAKQSGGRLREAADAVLTVRDNGKDKPIAAIEFCGALPAGNQAWQRQGRAFSFAHAQIPFFYVAELGGFELDSDRGRKAERMPNPAIPFSFLTMTHYQGSACLPVYEANPGATPETIGRYGPIFGKVDFLEFLQRAVLGNATLPVVKKLESKCAALVELLASSKRRQDGLSSSQWKAARSSMSRGQSLPDFLAHNVRLPWKKTAYIDGLTPTAKKFMEVGAQLSFGLTSTSLPLSFVPPDHRTEFSRRVQALYRDLSDDFSAWLGSEHRPLAISWVMGFKPRGADARPDRGLPPLARMLIGDSCDLLTFVYGPAPAAHWNDLAVDPVGLARRNGLWEAVLGVSDGVLVDSATKRAASPRAHLKTSWAAALRKEQASLRVEPKVLSFGEQDVDTALHVAFESLGTDIIFEGMCNPPGGDWSGISFRWHSTTPEHRWLTLPRVSAEGAKRPDHVFAVFGHGDRPVCLCIESKEHSRSLDPNIGTRLKRYAEALFETSPSIHRDRKLSPWAIYGADWKCSDLAYVSAGAYLASVHDPFQGVPDGTNLDVQIGVEFSSDGRRCTLHLRGDTKAGVALVKYLEGLPNWGEFVKVNISN